MIPGPVIVVARKGYAGRMFVVDDDRLIVHEDAYAVSPKDEYRDEIDLRWFVGHYSLEFHNNRTSSWGIGDFPRQRFSRMKVMIPSKEFQAKTARLYESRDKLLIELRQFPDRMETKIGSILADIH
jgi:hypothetical protein